MARARIEKKGCGTRKVPEMTRERAKEKTPDFKVKIKVNKKKNRKTSCYNRVRNFLFVLYILREVILNVQKL